MRYLTPTMIFILALSIGFFSIYGNQSYAALQSLRRSLVNQERSNAEVARTVDQLRQKVGGLEHDPRVLEKAARNELGMARPNELIFIFSKAESKR